MIGRIIVYKSDKLMTGYIILLTQLSIQTFQLHFLSSLRILSRCIYLIKSYFQSIGCFTMET